MVETVPDNPKESNVFYLKLLGGEDIILRTDSFGERQAWIHHFRSGASLFSYYKADTVMRTIERGDSTYEERGLKTENKYSTCSLDVLQEFIVLVSERAEREKGEKEDGGNAIVWFSLANSEIVYFRETPTTILVENPSSFKLLLKFSDSADVEKALFAISFR